MRKEAGEPANLTLRQARCYARTATADARRRLGLYAVRVVLREEKRARLAQRARAHL